MARLPISADRYECDSGSFSKIRAPRSGCPTTCRWVDTSSAVLIVCPGFLAAAMRLRRGPNMSGRGCGHNLRVRPRHATDLDGWAVPVSPSARECCRRAESRLAGSTVSRDRDRVLRPWMWRQRAARARPPAGVQGCQMSPIALSHVTSTLPASRLGGCGRPPVAGPRTGRD